MTHNAFNFLYLFMPLLAEERKIQNIYIYLYNDMTWHVHMFTPDLTPLTLY